MSDEALRARQGSRSSLVRVMLQLGYREDRPRAGWACCTRFSGSERPCSIEALRLWRCMREKEMSAGHSGEARGLGGRNPPGGDVSPCVLEASAQERGWEDGKRALESTISAASL